ncbi:hypothetical protein HPP92_000739 [Vanilla planifolia]|uniref:BHLH domain-containing protein n=1 Tax=Vanilla planifolia TaxID=51239 RepID=A0A835RSZ5_VANPL|nr:hypothetical protein HPP92_000874 [Vanilla planifolia]KAG0500667.1 hypothetical protein HPP92_000739 [Vanilla planifolia]
MAEDFNLSSWWSTNSTSSSSSELALTSTLSSSLSCSTSIPTTGGGATAFGAWSAGSNEVKPSLSNADGSPDSNLHLSGFGFSGNSPSMDWSQTLLRSGGIALQENPQLLFAPSPSSSSSSSSYGRSSSILQGLIVEQDPRLNQSFIENQHMSEYHSEVLAFRGVTNELQQQQLPQFFKNLPLPQNQQPLVINQLQFTNNAPFWNATSGFYDPPSLLPMGAQLSEPKASSSAPTAYKGEVRERQMGGETAMKKPRNESTPSPLPAFKVRKEKLGDRITALQQLVSPFGRTDTASVLQEAIDYIKFLHDQVIALSTPYLKNGHSMPQPKNSEKPKDCSEDSRQDLRSRGLCLVPIASTYSVANDTTADYWTPSYGPPYR